MGETLSDDPCPQCSGVRGGLRRWWLRTITGAARDHDQHEMSLDCRGCFDELDERYLCDTCQHAEKGDGVADKGDEHEKFHALAMDIGMPGRRRLQESPEAIAGFEEHHLARPDLYVSPYEEHALRRALQGVDRSHLRDLDAFAVDRVLIRLEERVEARNPSGAGPA